MLASLIHHHDEPDSGGVLGGKASALLELSKFNVPPWFVVKPEARNEPEADLQRLIYEACTRLSPEGTLFAVRSSAAVEDGREHSFAGQFDSFLNIPVDRVTEHVQRVWASASSVHVNTYAAQHGMCVDIQMAVLVQRMISPVCAGVAFAIDPVTGDDVVEISFVPSTADRLVSGEVTGHSVRVGHGGVVERTSTPNAGHELVDNTLACEIAAVVRNISLVRGSPQDVEWAWDGTRLHIVQARPITSAPVGELTIWDNSNIAESYAGVTTPLTFSFARRAYEEVYRTFCRLLGVPEAEIRAGDEVFRNMLGSLNGRVYYNLLNWYRLIAMLPGYRVNASFMEQMMGVESSLPDEAVTSLRRESTPTKPLQLCLSGVRLARSLAALLYRHITLQGRIKRFYRLLDTSLRPGEHPFSGRSALELVSEYRSLESHLLTRWDAPILNDFFAMIYIGLLRKLCNRVSEDGEGLHNALLLDIGDIVSVQPARRIEAMSDAALKIGPALIEVLERTDPADLSRLDSWPAFGHLVDDYIREFGDRCLEELKLETPTLRDDPTPLLRSIAAMARRPRLRARQPVEANGSDRRLRECLRGRPFTAVAARFVVPRARARVRDRENLRFARTRVFGYVRRLFVELGERYVAIGLLDSARDVFFLEVEEALGLATGVSTLLDPRGTVRSRREEFMRQQTAPPLPTRFDTRGSVNPVRPIVRPTAVAPESGSSSRLQGVGCCPGIVRGRARVVTNPIGIELAPGDILIAERTDPGWVMLFPAASGIVVQHGSVLSHTSIVARELGLPCVVAVKGLLERIADGDTVELDGSAGTITLQEPTP